MTHSMNDPNVRVQIESEEEGEILMTPHESQEPMGRQDVNGDEFSLVLRNG